jgi:hypothetical protein
MIKRLFSEYLLQPLRTLPEACRDIAAAHPERSVKDCDACAHGQLCACYRRCEGGGGRTRRIACACENDPAGRDAARYTKRR